MFDADAEPDGLRGDACGALLWRHLTVRRRRPMAGEGLYIAQIDQPTYEPERVVERLRRVQPAMNPDAHERAREAVQAFLRQRVAGTSRESDVADPGGVRIRAEEFRDGTPVRDMALNVPSDRLDSLP